MIKYRKRQRTKRPRVELVMDRKEKRDAKNARHKANNERRFERRVDRMVAAIRPQLDEWKRKRLVRAGIAAAEDE